MKSILKRPEVQSLIIGLMALATYFPAVSAHRRVDPDAQFILTILNNFKSLPDYLSALFSLKTMDFQPVRDLSLFLDQFAFDHLGTNTFVFQNLLWWTGICYLILKILRSLFPDLKPSTIALVVLAFALYPLFTASIPWGMARKHILSMFFILFSTEKLISAGLGRITQKNKTFIVSAYFLGIFSQPIGILWPFWGLSFVWFLRPDLKKDYIRIIPSLAIIFVAGLVANTLYYESSSVFLNLFPKKSTALFQIGSQLLALGHYSFTMVAPYFLTFINSLGQWSTLAGIVVIVIFGVSIYKKKSRFVFVWLGFLIFPLVTVLQMPEILQDTYLLLPSVGLLILLVHFFKESPVKYQNIYWIIIPLWGALSYQRSSLWLSTSEVARSSFDVNPSCASALATVRIDYTFGLDAYPAALSFAKNNDCFAHTINSPENAREAELVRALMLRYDNELSLEKRSEYLKQGYINGNFYGHLYLVSLYVEFKQMDTQMIYLDELLPKLKNGFYDVVIERDLLPYCESSMNKKCIEILKPISKRPVLPYL